MKRNKTWLTLGILLISILLLSACSSSGKTQPVEESLPPQLPEDVDSLVILAKFDLTIKTGVDIENIVTKSIKETLFDDSSLGVPEAGVTFSKRVVIFMDTVHRVRRLSRFQNKRRAHEKGGW